MLARSEKTNFCSMCLKIVMGKKSKAIFWLYPMCPAHSTNIESIENIFRRKHKKLIRVVGGGDQVAGG